MSRHDARLLEAPGLANRVLELLAGKQLLPRHGIVAGQAVASALDEILGTGAAVYNDIDLFLEEDEWYAETRELFIMPTVAAKKAVSSRIQFSEKPTLIPDDYAKAFSIASRTLYRVLKADRDGMLNRVLVDFAQQTGSRAGRLVDAFDLNSIQVGIDLKTRKLTWTAQFAEYFAGRELRIVNLHTPFQSLLRYFKKREELGAFGHDALQIEMVRHIVYANEGDVIHREDRIRAFQQGWRWMPKESIESLYERSNGLTGGQQFMRTGTGVKGLPMAIGKKYEKLLQTWLPKLSPYFEIWKHPRINVWLLTSRPEARPLPYVGALPSTPTLLSHRFRELKLPAGPLALQRRREFARFTAWLSPELRRMYREAYRFQGDEFLAGVESQSGWRDLQRILNEHDEVVSVVAAMPIGQQIELVRRVKTELKRINSPLAWGIFRGKRADWARRAIEDRDWLRREVVELLGSAEPLIESNRLLPLPEDIDGVQVRELYTNRDLRIEGGKMHHCVGGYGGAVESGMSRIISLVAGPTSRDCSTVEWRRERHLNEEGNYVVALSLIQHYGFSNTTPADVLIAAEASLRKRINTWLLQNLDDAWRMLYEEERPANEAEPALEDVEPFDEF